MNRSLHNKSFAFSLIELLVAIVIIAILVALILPALHGTHTLARTAVCKSNLHQIGVAHHSYAADFGGIVGALHGKTEDKALSVSRQRLPGFDNQPFPFTRDCGTQAKSIIVANAHPTNDLADFAPPSGRAVPTVVEQFSHLALVDYLSSNVLSPIGACPEDRARLFWQRSSIAVEKSPFAPQSKENSANAAWFRYSSSYQLMPAAYLTDKKHPNLQEILLYGQSTQHAWYHDQGDWSTDKYSGEGFVVRRIDEIAFPALKVCVADSIDRHCSAKPRYFAMYEACQPLLFWDGSVSLRKTRDGNRGWDRAKMRSIATSTFSYVPDLGFEPPAVDAVRKWDAIKAGYYKWTRGGLQGTDFGGGELDTSNW